MDLSKKERLWVSRMERLFRDKPENLLVYTTDYEMVVCKRGVSSAEFSRCIPGSSINCGNVLTDMHDDMGRGAGGERFEFPDSFDLGPVKRLT